jgi:hypothetical protein
MNENWKTSISNFFTKEEKIELLREYRKSLEQEVKGIDEIIQQLERNN